MGAMQTSGIVLDVYDDIGGEVLRSVFPEVAQIPVFIKEAHALTPEERVRLPDDAFALVLLNGEEKLRKYACVDEGNTTLSVLYFLKHAHKLPREARQRVAENLKVACGWYDLDVPEELEKEAISHHKIERIVGRTRASASRLAKFEDKMHEGAKRLDGLPGRLGEIGRKFDNASNAAHRKLEGIDAANTLKKQASLIGKAIELPAKAVMNRAAKDPFGTAMTVMTAPSVVRGTRDKINQNLAKVNVGGQIAGVRGELASMAGPHELGHVAREMGKAGEVTGTTCMPISADPTKKPSTPMAAIKKSAHLRPVVDVTDKEPEKMASIKKASRYALGDKYPLDSYEQVKLANDYFAEYGRKLSPEERHAYCANLVKRASELQIPLHDVVRKYGSEKYASAGEVAMAIDTRRGVISPEHNELLDKIAAAMPAMPPEDFIIVLSEFDKVAGIDHLYDADVMDPFYTAYGFEKTAEDDKENFTDVVGNYYVTAADLKRLCSNKQWLESTFGGDFCEEYCKDPVGIYKSMPVEQKKLIIRMATENSPV